MADPKPSKRIPSAADVLRTTTVIQDARSAQEEYVEEARENAIDSQVEYERLRGLHDHFTHKALWSWFLMLLMGGLVSFQSYLLFKVGVGAWDFSQYDWLLPALLVQNLAQIIGLAFVVVRSLFR